MHKKTLLILSLIATNKTALIASEREWSDEICNFDDPQYQIIYEPEINWDILLPRQNTFDGSNYNDLSKDQTNAIINPEIPQLETLPKKFRPQTKFASFAPAQQLLKSNLPEPTVNQKFFNYLTKEFAYKFARAAYNTAELKALYHQIEIAQNEERKKAATEQFFSGLTIKIQYYKSRASSQKNYRRRDNTGTLDASKLPDPRMPYSNEKFRKYLLGQYPKKFTHTASNNQKLIEAFNKIQFAKDDFVRIVAFNNFCGQFSNYKRNYKELTF